LEIEPQFLPSAAHVVGLQPHTPGVPLPPHVWNPLHVPHEIVPPQPSSCVPQLWPPVQVVRGMQTQ
jgi:hypothetical protein